MRRYGFPACSIGVTCAAALSLAPGLTGGRASAEPASATGSAAVPGSTRSLPLAPLTRDPGPAPDRGAPFEQGLRRTDVRHFSLVGVVWDDPDTELRGGVRIRTRSAATGVCNSAGIAVIGTYGTAKPSSAAVTADARLTAWKLGLYGMNPRGKTYPTSGGGNLYQKGKSVRPNVISGHRDGFATDCPGQRLYGKLDAARSAAACYQGR
ncbi:hypothetical protein [Streptomyces sp. NPDC087437]|uniref:hypothetical protein n=1 Tax=Streptomyces sp. NPDC087437 TaxID=3365789 RepID=UPI00382E7EFB